MLISPSRQVPGSRDVSQAGIGGRQEVDHHLNVATIASDGVRVDLARVQRNQRVLKRILPPSFRPPKSHMPRKWMFPGSFPGATRGILRGENDLALLQLDASAAETRIELAVLWVAAW